MNLDPRHGYLALCRPHDSLSAAGGRLPLNRVNFVNFVRKMP
jgi:hypothetical protein